MKSQENLEILSGFGTMPLMVLYRLHPLHIQVGGSRGDPPWFVHIYLICVPDPSCLEIALKSA